MIVRGAAVYQNRAERAGARASVRIVVLGDARRWCDRGRYTNCKSSSMRSRLENVLLGGAAGIAATAAMSLVMLAGKRIGALGEPPPRRLTRRLLAPLGAIAPSGSRLYAAALGAHFGFGAAMGGVWGFLPERLQTNSCGLVFGFGVWATNYAGWLPAVGLMPPPSKDRLGRPTTMLVAHLVYGGALALLTRRAHARRRQRRPAPLLTANPMIHGTGLERRPSLGGSVTGT